MYTSPESLLLCRACLVLRALDNVSIASENLTIDGVFSMVYFHIGSIIYKFRFRHEIYLVQSPT